MAVVVGILVFVVLFALIFSFSTWAGSRIQEKYQFALDGKVRKFDKNYDVYRSGDPYRYLYRLFHPTKLIISDTHLFIVGNGRYSSFFMHMLGILNMVSLKGLCVIDHADNVIEFKFEDEGGFVQNICVSGGDSSLILELIETKPVST